MKNLSKNLCLFAALGVIFGSVPAFAQAPAGATGKCKDGTYATAAKKSGACSGHKGVDTWYAASGNQTAAPTTPAPASPNASSTAGAKTSAPPPAPSPKPASSPSSARPQAQGGGPGMVWVNTSSKVYHCPGTEFYGKTKQGKYLSESDALASGARADHGKACSK